MQNANLFGVTELDAAALRETGGGSIGVDCPNCGGGGLRPLILNGDGLH